MASAGLSLEEFLRPLDVNTEKIHSLAKSLTQTFTRLAAESTEQFLSTPISEPLLRQAEDLNGRYLAIDIGGTNLRVGFIELLGSASGPSQPTAEETIRINGTSRVKRLLEQSWPIGEHLKNEKANDLFAWIGRCIAEVVKDGYGAWPGELTDEIPLGVTFSFPMIQHTLSEATLMPMGKGFAITSSLDLGTQLVAGYEASRDPSLPRIKIAAIVNDAVATLVSFAYQVPSTARRKAAMGLIVGTGCNATIPLALSRLNHSKRPKNFKVLDGTNTYDDPKVIVNTEFTINGAASPLHELNFVTKWDRILDAECEAPGFQPFEYMTAGRYLGELGRIMTVDYFTQELHIPQTSLPLKLRERLGLTTAFLGCLRPRQGLESPSLVQQLEAELPPSGEEPSWNDELASAVYRIGKAIQVRAAGMAAAAIIGLLACANDIQLSAPSPAAKKRQISNSQTTWAGKQRGDTEEVLVGYTGGCIVHFQDYLQDCQQFLDEIMEWQFGENPLQKVVLCPCNDGGIIGAGILAGTVHTKVHDKSGIYLE